MQILTLKLDGITAGDYLTWYRDPDPPVLGLALRSVSIDADSLGETITAILDWNESPPPASAAASAAGLRVPHGVRLYASLIHRSKSRSAPRSNTTGSARYETAALGVPTRCAATTRS
jgi:hypothetical protein